MARGPHCAGGRGETSAGAWRSISASSATSAQRFDALTPLINENRSRTHLDQATQHYPEGAQELDALAASSTGKRPIHPQQIARAISDHAAADAIFTCDVGLPTVWAARYLKMNALRRVLKSILAMAR